MPTVITVTPEMLTLTVLVLSIGWGVVQHHWQEKAKATQLIDVELKREIDAAKVEERLARRATEVRLALDNQAELIRVKQEALEVRLLQLFDVLERNTQLTQAGLTRANEAYHEASNVNVKIAQASGQVVAVLARVPLAQLIAEPQPERDVS